MIARLWHGWTSPGNADAYERLLRQTILPGIHRIGGYQGAWLLRRTVGGEVEFVTLTLWDSPRAVEEFAGREHGAAVVPEAARRLLARFDRTSLHYDGYWVE
jgi:heme-degrading monooxygenase HmoA